MRPISILMYHSLDESGSILSISPKVFAKQMAGLTEHGFHGISLKQALEHYKLHKDWPTERVIITFDDAYANVYEYGIPTLAEHHFTSTIYAVAGYAGHTNTWSPLPPKMNESPLMTWQQLYDASENGMEIGSHSMTHPDLTKLPPEDVELELLGSRDLIQDRIGKPVDTFAYPHGRFNNVASDLASRTFTASCSMVLKRASNQPLHLLPRVDMFYIQSCEQLMKCVRGNLDGYLTLRRWKRNFMPKL
jgi:peptidoglycan/xylan/chitin deacetylase (PgdA/CDA1 family)